MDLQPDSSRSLQAPSSPESAAAGRSDTLPSRAAIGLVLRGLRSQSGFSLAALGMRAGMTTSSLCRTESGHRDLGLAEAASLCRHLDIPIDRFVDAVEKIDARGPDDEKPQVQAADAEPPPA